MHYVLYVPGMAFNGETLSRGQSLGGSESAAYYLARELARRGHEVTVFGSLRPEAAGTWDGVRYLPAGTPGEHAPLGPRFEAYAAATPVDVLIAQRVPDAFARPVNARVTLWWTHDLALKRHQPALNRQLWNVNAVLAVSEFHRGQLCRVYGLPPERVAVVPNGVDTALFPAVPGAAKRGGKVLVYSSRPERGLEHLVGSADEPGIMERLHAADPELTLKVCGYDNTTPALAAAYARLWARCRELPNVTWLGPQSKPALARLMAGAWLHVYPTAFEETSCITAMEAQCAGTPVVTAPVGALPETLAGGGAVWVPPTPEGAVDRAAYARAVLALRDDPARWDALHAAARTRGAACTWQHAADAVEQVVSDAFARQCADPARVARHLLHHSDIGALRHLLARHGAPDDAPPRDPILADVQRELARHYAFAASGDPAVLRAHYDAIADREARRGNDHGLGSDRHETEPRVQALLGELRRLPPGSRVLDYGCGPGHVTEALARRFPQLRFTGVELAAALVAQGRRYLAEHPRPNLALHVLGEHPQETYDLVLALEVLEHVPEPATLAATLEGLARPGGRVVATVPSGPWEALAFDRAPHRQHLHHLERADLVALFGVRPGFALRHLPAGATPRGEALGHHLVAWTVPPSEERRPFGRVDYARKLARQRPRETLSVCMVVRPDGDTLARTLKSVAPLADEIVIGVDVGDAAAPGGAPESAAPPLAVADLGHAGELGRRFGARVFALPSPLRTGFAAARNATLERAHGDWVLWIDDDEELLWPERLHKYLRDNPYDACAVPQQHYAVEPGGLLKTDYPCRLFRNRRGFRFYGLVHEHPELALNAGAGHVLLLPDVAICHNGYVTEAVRRARFRRNLPLMQHDRRRHPQRTLGRFLWIRDLAHLNRFEAEAGAPPGTEARARAEEAVALWRGLLAEGHVRLALDALPYYSEAAHLLAGGGLDCALDLGLRAHGLGDPPDRPGASVRACFADPDDLERLTLALLREKTAALTDKYV